MPPLPVVRPAPAAAAAGESPTASAPLPAACGCTPEQRVGTERQESGKLSTRRQREEGEIYRTDESRSTRTTGKKAELVGGGVIGTHLSQEKA